MKKISVDSFNMFVEKFANHDLDVVDELYKNISRGIKNSYKKVSVFEVYCRESEAFYKLSIDHTEYPIALKGCLNTYIENEMYEKCSEVKSLLENIKN